MNTRWLIASFVIGVAMTALVRHAARTFGIVNHPNPIVPQHRAPVAYLGGVAIALAMLATALLALAMHVPSAVGAFPARLWVPATLFLLLGTYDDLRPLRAITKLALQCVAAIVAVVMGLVWPLTGIDAVDAAASVIWFLLLVNAFNVTDVCDGLVAGLSVVMLVFASAHTSDPWALTVTVGTVLGFLVFNRPPASIFLGDGGSHLLGFLVAASLVLAMSPAGDHLGWKHAAAAALATGVVLLEVALLIYSRVKAGIPWWRGSPHHFSLRLQARGLSRLKTDVVAWVAAAALCVIAAFLPRFSNSLAVMVALATVLLLIAAIRILLRWEVRR